MFNHWPLSDHLDYSASYITTSTLEALGVVSGGERDILEFTNNLALSYIKDLSILLAQHQSEYIRRFVLCFCSELHDRSVIGCTSFEALMSRLPTLLQQSTIIATSLCDYIERQVQFHDIQEQDITQSTTNTIPGKSVEIGNSALLPLYLEPIMSCVFNTGRSLQTRLINMHILRAEILQLVPGNSVLNSEQLISSMHRERLVLLQQHYRDFLRSLQETCIVAEQGDVLLDAITNPRENTDNADGMVCDGVHTDQTTDCPVESLSISYAEEKSTYEAYTGPADADDSWENSANPEERLLQWQHDLEVRRVARASRCVK